VNPQFCAIPGNQWEPASRSRRAGVRLLAGVLWAVTVVSVAWLAPLVGLAAVWGVAAGAALGGPRR
jgi:hypothetical protein